MLNQRLYELTKLPEPPYLGAGYGQGRWIRSKEFAFLAAGVKENGFDVGLEALLTEAARARRFGFTQSELRREKKDMLRSMEQAYRERDKLRSEGFAAEYIRHLLEDEPIPGVEKEFELHKRLLPTIDLAEVNEFASKWTGDSNRVITVNAPEKEDVPPPSEADLLAVFERVESKEITPYEDDVSDLPLVERVPEPAAITARDSIPEIGVTKWVLSQWSRGFPQADGLQERRDPVSLLQSRWELAGRRRRLRSCLDGDVRGYTGGCGRLQPDRPGKDPGGQSGGRRPLDRRSSGGHIGIGVP